MKFRKKPVVVEAWRFNGLVSLIEPMPEWIHDKDWYWSYRDNDVMYIRTLEGDHMARPGDWIIQGVQGEIYPCKPDIFEATYEPVNEEN